MPIGCHNDVVYALVIHLCQSAERIVALIKHVGAVGGTYNNMFPCLCQAHHRVAAQQVGMLGIVAKHVHLPPVIATKTSTVCSIPQEPF